MPMRILHFSDLHIGVENYGRVDPETGLSTRLGDFLTSLDQLVEHALTQDVDLVLMAGDAYKGRDPSQTHQREFARRLARLSAAGIPVFLLVGNHDLPNAASRATAVEIFPTLQVPNIYVGSNLQIYQVATRSGPLQVLAVPWPRRSSLLSREESRGFSIDEVRQETERRITEAVAGRVEQLDPDIPAILTGHVTVNGATVGSERSMMVGQDHVLQVSALHHPSLDYVGLGHIHKHQVLRRDSPLMAYSGSLQRVDFSEEKDQKGFCIIELEPSAPQGSRLVDFRFEGLQARPFVTVDVKIAPGEPDPTNAVLRAIARNDIADAVVRVRINLPSEAEPQLREAEIRSALEPSHFVAAINKEVEGSRRTRLDAETAEELQPLEALKLYLDSRSVEADRKERVLQRGQQVIEEELSRRSD